MMMLPAFFARVKPVSTIAKPACMKNTNAAPIRNQMPNTSLKIFSIIVTSLCVTGQVFYIIEEGDKGICRYLLR